MQDQPSHRGPVGVQPLEALQGPGARGRCAERLREARTAATAKGSAVGSKDRTRTVRSGPPRDRRASGAPRGGRPPAGGPRAPGPPLTGPAERGPSGSSTLEPRASMRMAAPGGLLEQPATSGALGPGRLPPDEVEPLSAAGLRGEDVQRVAPPEQLLAQDAWGSHCACLPRGPRGPPPRPAGRSARRPGRRLRAAAQRNGSVPARQRSRGRCSQVLYRIEGLLPSLDPSPRTPRRPADAAGPLSAGTRSATALRSR